MEHHQRRDHQGEGSRRRHEFEVRDGDDFALEQIEQAVFADGVLDQQQNAPCTRQHVGGADARLD